LIFSCPKNVGFPCILGFCKRLLKYPTKTGQKVNSLIHLREKKISELFFNENRIYVYRYFLEPFRPVDKVKVELKYPNVAVDQFGNIGTWTMIYNQVCSKDQKFLGEKESHIEKY